MDPKIVKAGTLKSLKFTPEAHRGPSGTSDDSKMKSRGHSRFPKWPHRAVLAPLGGPKNTILEHLWLSESVSDPHFAVKRSLKNRREFCLCKMCDFQKSPGGRVPGNQNVDLKKRRAFCHCRPVTPRRIWPQSI